MMGRSNWWPDEARTEAGPAGDLALAETPTIELASRESGGIRVALLWSRGDATLRVTVFDAATEARFELEAVEHEALDVFYHPYAYAASRAAGKG